MNAAAEALISTVAASVAALAALVALVFAWRTLKENRATIGELQKLREAAQAEMKAEQATTLALHMILTRTQADRAIEQLQVIADQVFAVQLAMQGIRDQMPTWHELKNAKQLLDARLSILPPEVLPACRHLATTSADPREDDKSEVLAADEIRTEIGHWRLRQTEVTAQENAQLRRLAAAPD